MKKEIILTIIILVIIIVSDIFITRTIDDKIDNVSKELEVLKGEIDEEPKEVIDNKFKSIEELWGNTENNFSFYIEHDELEKVGTEMNSIKSYIESEEWSDAKNDIQKLQFILEHIKDKMDLKLKNIF